MNRTARFLLTFLFIVLLFSFKTSAQTEATVMEVGKPVERLLRTGETHTYKIIAAAGQFLHVEVEELYFDVSVALFAPDGEKLIETDNRLVLIAIGIEEIHAITETAGEFRLEIRGSKTTFAQGYYSAKLNELHLPTSEDSLKVKAASMIGEGKQLQNKYNARDNSTSQFLNTAIEKYKEAVTLFQAAKNLGGEIDALRKIAVGNRLLKDFPKAIEYSEKALNLAEKLGDRQQIGRILFFLSYENYRAQNYTKSHELLDKACLIFETTGNKFDLFSIPYEKGDQYRDVGEYEKALEQYQKAASIGETIPDFERLGYIWTQFGIVYNRSGNSWKSLEYHLKAFEFFERFGDKNWVARTSINLGVSYGILNNLDLSLFYIQKAYNIWNEKRGTQLPGDGLATAIVNIGVIYRFQGKYDEALKKHQEALEIFERLKDTNGIASTYHGFGLTYHSQRDYNRALENYGRALEIYKGLPSEKGKYAGILSFIAEVYLEQGNYQQALDFAQQATNISEQIGHSSSSSVRLRMLTGKAYLGLNQPEKARQAFEAAIAIAETLFARGQSFGGMTQSYIEMVGLLSSEGNAIEAFSYAERVKSRTLLDILQNGRIDITKTMSTEERETETKLKKEMVSLNSKISDEKDKTRLAELQKQLKAKRLEFEEFQIRLYATKPELKVQRGKMKPVSLDEAAKLLPDDKSALLEYVVGQDKSFLFVITKNSAQKVSLKVYPIEIKRKDLAKQSESFRSKIAKGDLDFARASQDLYNLLLKPAEAQLKNKTNLVIVPDNALWDLPFQTLQPTQNKYLIETSAISYAPSLTALDEMAKKNKGKQFSGATLLAFGNPTVNKATSDQLKQVFMSDSLEPLPEAERLVKSLQKMYGANRSKVFVGAEAREETAKTESSKFRIVQFAAHGILNDFAPMYSNIVLAQKQNDPNEDGLLEAWEMKDLDLNADMVILSACETARGQVSNGEGVIGMSWALFIAGAPTTVASQWKVESSSTTELMLEFHRQLLNGKESSKAEALRRASLKLLKTAKYRHPSYWAGFVLVGDGS